MLCNRPEECPGRPSQPIDIEQVCNYLISKKATQKENHDKRHNVKPLTELNPGQVVLFLSPVDPHEYIKGTITLHASTPKCLTIKAQGRTYCCIHQHICHLHSGTAPIPRPCSFQDPEPEDNNQTAAEPSITTITRPCDFQDHEQEGNSQIAADPPISIISRPSSKATEPPVSTIPRPLLAKPIPA